jgi:hypothetical protein
MSAMNSLGFFSEPSYISIGDPYASSEGAAVPFVIEAAAVQRTRHAACHGRSSFSVSRARMF